MATLDWSQCPAVESVPGERQWRLGIQGHPDARCYGF